MSDVLADDDDDKQKKPTSLWNLNELSTAKIQYCRAKVPLNILYKPFNFNQTILPYYLFTLYLFDHDFDVIPNLNDLVSIWNVFSILLRILIIKLFSLQSLFKWRSFRNSSPYRVHNNTIKVTYTCKEVNPTVT